MTDDERRAEGADETIEDLDAPAEALDEVAGGVIACKLPTQAQCPSPTCNQQTFCLPGTGQNCSKPTCHFTAIAIQ